MHNGEPVIHKSVPLALGLMSTSNPQAPTPDTLSKYSHDSGLAAALNAIFAMGLTSAGTNHARLSATLPAITARRQTAYLWSTWCKVSCMWARDNHCGPVFL